MCAGVGGGGWVRFFTLDRDEGDGDGVSGTVGLVWLHATPQAFDDSSLKDCEQTQRLVHLLATGGVNSEAGGSRRLFYMKHVRRPSQVDGDETEDKERKDVRDEQNK